LIYSNKNSMKILIEYNKKSLKAELFDTPTGKAIYNALPFSGAAQIWGKEAYFTININQELEENAQEKVPNGGLAFWPSGNCFCIFWGQTPVSAVNIFGQISGDINELNNLQANEIITVKKA